MNFELESIWKGAVVAYFKVLAQNETPQSR